MSAGIIVFVSRLVDDLLAVGAPFDKLLPALTYNC